MNTTTLRPTNDLGRDGAAVLGRRAMLDEAHIGDIRGALGTVRQHETRPRSRRGRLLALLAIMGSG